MRDFLASRVVDGRQQIRAAITFHESGRLVMWPYGYTHDERAGRHDHGRPRALMADRQAHGRHERLQARAGERPVHHLGDDHATTSTAPTGSSPTRSRCRSRTTPTIRLIPSETGRNKEAVLYLMERAWLPASRPRGGRPGRRAAAPSTTTSRSPAAGRSTPTAPTRRARRPVRPGQPPGDHELRREAARHDAVRLRRLRDRRAGGSVARAPTTSTA